MIAHDAWQWRPCILHVLQVDFKWAQFAVRYQVGMTPLFCRAVIACGHVATRLTRKTLNDAAAVGHAASGGPTSAAGQTWDDQRVAVAGGVGYAGKSAGQTGGVGIG